MATSASAIAVTLQLLSAQVNLTETFNHILRTAPKRECLAFRLKAERGTEESTFVIELGSERHTLTLPNDKKMHLKLADFIEEIANGPLDTSNKGDLAHRPHADRQYGRFEVQDKQRVPHFYESRQPARQSAVWSSYESLTDHRVPDWYQS